MGIRMGFLVACITLIVGLALPVEAQKRRDGRAKEKQPRIQSVTIILSDKGFEPATFKLRRGVPARITFLRQVEVTCATEIVLADYGIKRDLPLNEPVVVEFTPQKSGEFSFACAMDMVRGKIVVR